MWGLFQAARWGGHIQITSGLQRKQLRADNTGARWMAVWFLAVDSWEWKWEDGAFSVPDCALLVISCQHLPPTVQQTHLASVSDLRKTAPGLCSDPRSPGRRRSGRGPRLRLLNFKQRSRDLIDPGRDSRWSPGVRRELHKNTTTTWGQRSLAVNSSAGSTSREGAEVTGKTLFYWSEWDVKCFHLVCIRSANHPASSWIYWGFQILLVF